MDIRKIARRCVLELSDYVPGKPIEEVRRELGLTDILKMASNENPLGTSPKALEAMMQDLKENTHYYPEGSAPMLTERLAALLGLRHEQFFVNNGGDGVIAAIGLGFIDPGDEVITSQFTFPAYKNVTGRMDGKIILTPMLPGYRFDVDAILSAVTERTKIVFLCNPNNPTGTIISRDEFERVISRVPEHVLVVCDEAYYEFAEDPDYPQTIPYLEKFPNLMILRTFSKAMGLAGVRVGYAIAHPEIIRVLNKVKDPFPVNRLAQVGALASLDDHEFIQRSVQAAREGRQQFYRALDTLQISYCPSQTNFIFIDLGQPAQPVFEFMLRQGVIVRPLGPQGLPNAIRITFGTREQNERALQALAAALGKTL